jgi:hypothetical protein
MKAIPITKKLCTAGGGYASPAKIDPATPASEEKKPEKTAAEKKLFL